MNGGIRSNLLKIAKEKGVILEPEDEKYMNDMLALSKNVWVDLDKDMKSIPKEQADINKFKIII